MQHGTANGFVLPVDAKDVAMYFEGMEHKDVIYVLAMLEYPASTGRAKTPHMLEITRQYIAGVEVSMDVYAELRPHMTVSLKQSQIDRFAQGGGSWK